MGQIIEIPRNAPLYNKCLLGNFDVYNKEEIIACAHKTYDLFDGFIVGEHHGLEHYQLGQRKGIDIGGKTEPLYVIGINKPDNQLFVGQGKDHPGLKTRVLYYPKSTYHFINQNDEITWRAVQNSNTVEIQSHDYDISCQGMLFMIENNLYIKLENATSIRIYNYPIQIKYQQNIIIETI